jgi:hypothetical protein
VPPFFASVQVDGGVTGVVPVVVGAGVASVPPSCPSTGFVASSPHAVIQGAATAARTNIPRTVVAYLPPRIPI